MGRLSTEARKGRARKRTLGAPKDDFDSQLKELGDPNFTSSLASQGQVPAAAAEKKKEENARSAQRVLANAEQFGYDITSPDFDPIREAAQTGISEEKGSFVASAIGWLDGPRQAMNLLIQDMIGGEAKEGFRNPNFGDYWNAWWSGIDDPQEFELATGLNPLSGSTTLDMFGYEESDNLGGKILRGVADFSLQVLTDPLTYLTFGLSGLGKKVALAAGREFQGRTIYSLVGLMNKAPTSKLYKNALEEAVELGSKGSLSPYSRQLGGNIDGIVQEFTDDVIRFKAKVGGNLPPDMEKAFKNYLGRGGKNIDQNTVVELALANRMFKDVIQPVVNRSFGRKINRKIAGRGDLGVINQLALKELPAFFSGGARISVPFIGGPLKTPGRTLGTLQAGIVIPGTQGLGRKLVGDPIRQLSKNFKKLGLVGKVWDDFLTAIQKGASNMDRFTPIMQGLKDGSIEGWQYHIAGRAIDAMSNNADKHVISTELNAMWNNITGLSKDAGKDLSQVGRDVMQRLDTSDLDEVLALQVRNAQKGVAPQQGIDMRAAGTVGDLDIGGDIFPGPIQTGNKELDDALGGMVTYLQEVMGGYHQALAVLDPDFADKFIKGYVPHSVSKPARKFMAAFAKESSGKAGKGSTAEDVWAHLLNGIGGAAASAPLIGGSMHVGRKLGRGQGFKLYSDRLLMLDKTSLEVLALEKKVILPFGPNGEVITDTLEAIGLSVPELNDLLKPVILRESDRLGISMPHNWDGKVFNENPIEVMLDYLDSMTDAINSWNLMDSLKASGLAFTHTAELNVQDVAQKIMNNAMRTAATMPISGFGRPVQGETAMAPLDFLERIVQVKDADQAVKNVTGKAKSAELNKKADLIPSIKAKGVQKPVTIEVWEDGSYRLAEGHNRLAAARVTGNTPEVPVVFVAAGPTLPPPKNDTVGMMKMKPGWFEEARETQGGAAAVRGKAFDDGRFVFVEGDPTWDAYQALEVVPWGPVPLERNLLHGGTNQGPIPGVPLNVHQDLARAGFVIKGLPDVADTRKLANDVVSMEPSGWATPAPAGGVPPSPLTNVDEVLLAQAPGAHFWKSRTIGNETTHVFSVAVGRKGVQGLKKTAKAAAVVTKGNEFGGTKLNLYIKGGPDRPKQRQAIVEWLDRAFDEGGDLEGMFSARGIDELVAAGMDKQTSELLHQFARNKIGKMGRDAKEFISKEPAEIFDARLLYEETRQGLNEWLTDVAGVRVGGSLISGPESLELFGTDATVKRLRALQDAANRLDNHGYDDLAKVMRDVDSFSGVQTIDKMINPAMFNLQGPAIEGLSIQTNIAQWLSLTARNMGAIYTPEGIAAAKLAARETLRWWRGMATLPRAAFHIRNLVGGSWMNASVGVQAKTMAEVSQYTLRFRNAIRNAPPGQAMETAFEVLPAGRIREGFREAMSRNVLAGFATTEFSGVMTPKAMAKRWDFLNALDIDNFALTRAGGRIMESVEDFMRMSLFMQYYDNTVKGSGQFAAELVNAIHFNYSDLTPWETKMKSIIPFFVWARRNTPLQIQMAVENPRYVQRYRAMMQAMNDNLGGNDPDNLQEADHFTAYVAGTNYKVNPETPFWARIMIDPDLPISDLLELPTPTDPRSLIEFADGLLGPHISFLGDVNAQADIGDVNAPAPYNWILKSLAAFGLYNTTTDGDVRMPYLMRTLLETVVPFSRELADPLSGGPTDPNRQQRLGIHPDDDYLTRTLKSIGGQLIGGVGVKLTTPSDARSAAFRSAEDMQKLLKELRLQDIAPQAGQTTQKGEDESDPTPPGPPPGS